MSLRARRHLTRCTTCGWRLAVRSITTDGTPAPTCERCLPPESEDDDDE